MNELPLVSCIMPTRLRTKFVARSVDYFLQQDYPNKELVIFEEESRSSPHVSFPKEVRYLQWDNLHYKSIGQKRNAMCAYAGGELIAHWDDDDWHAPNRLSMQVELMRSQGARLCGADRLVFYNGERAWLFQTPRKPWLAGGTLVYERSLWQEQHFDAVSDGEDTAFVDAAYRRNAKVAVISDPSLYVAVLHDANTTKRDTTQWSGFDVQQVRRWIEGSKCSD